MKKLAILLFTILLIVTSYNTFVPNKGTKSNKEEKNTTAYRAEDNKNLIEATEFKTEEEPITDEEFTSYIETIDSEVTAITTKEKHTAKDEKVLTNTFITLTDFIFYGGEIKGKTFASLTEGAKQQVIALYEKIDAEIESVFPGYKEKIKETSTKTYNNIKDKLTELKASALEKYKNEIGEDKYNDQVETFNESKETMKESFTPVIEKVIDESKNFYETTKDKLDNWYQSWKEENR